MLEHKIKLENVNLTIIENHCIELFGLPNELKHVFLNIINNAIDAFVEQAIKKRNITVTIDAIETEAIICINDSGGGISDTLLPTKLFELYASSKGEKGTGIGLSICKTIIEEKFKGTIDAQNTKEGAAFVMRFNSNYRRCC